MQDSRVVITGVGLTSPNGNNLAEFRQALLTGKSGIKKIETRYLGEVPAGVCNFDELKYQKQKEVRRGTRSGSIAIYCSNEALADSKITVDEVGSNRVGVYLGITEHGNVETENEIFKLSKFNYDIKFWTHHHNPRTVANAPAGEVTLNLGIRGPHLCIGAACAAGNLGIVHGVQMLRLDEVDLALSGGVSESIHSFGIFASFKAQNALAHHEDPTKASRPFAADRNGIVVSEGGCIFTLERLNDALARDAKIYGEIVGYAHNSDATDFVLPDPVCQAECMRLALKRAGLNPSEIDIINTHGTGTQMGDEQECQAIREVFDGCSFTHVNNTKSFIGHAMGAAGALELAGNLPAFEDCLVHPTINLEKLDPECYIENLVIDEPYNMGNVNLILNNSFGMLGINSVVIVRRFVK